MWKGNWGMEFEGGAAGMVRVEVVLPDAAPVEQQELGDLKLNVQC